MSLQRRIDELRASGKGALVSLRQNAAKARYLRNVLKIPVHRKPNGRPLVLRSDWDRRNESAQNARLGSGPKWSK
jgi:hypothetical protein